MIARIPHLDDGLMHAVEASQRWLGYLETGCIDDFGRAIVTRQEIEVVEGPTTCLWCAARKPKGMIGPVRRTRR